MDGLEFRWINSVIRIPINIRRLYTIYYIEQKGGHRYEFHNVRGVRTEYQQGGVEVLVISAQFKPRQRYKDVRILPETIKDTNIKDVEYRMLTWLS